MFWWQRLQTHLFMFSLFCGFWGLFCGFWGLFTMYLLENMGGRERIQLSTKSERRGPENRRCTVYGIYNFLYNEEVISLRDLKYKCHVISRNYSFPIADTNLITLVHFTFVKANWWLHAIVLSSLVSSIKCYTIHSMHHHNSWMHGVLETNTKEVILFICVICGFVGCT
jgi:hypothetical protein